MEHATASPKQAEHNEAGALHRGPAAEAAPALHPGLVLQQQSGNQAMQALLRAGVIHAKLSISQPGDPDEQEADAVAAHIMRSHAGAEAAAADSCSCGGDEEGMCDECRQKAAVSRKATAPGPSPAASHSVLSALHHSHGSPLDARTRAFFEPRFGRDFSGVRIHTDSEAADSARSIQAHAFTTGSEIYFAPGKYAPQTDDGRRLLAHELTHVAQGNTHRSQHLSRQEGGGAEAGTEQLAHKDDELDAGVPPSPSTSTADTGPLNFEGLMLSTYSVSIVGEIEKYVQAHGLDELAELKRRFESELRTLGYNQRDKAGPADPNDKELQRLTKMNEVAPTFRLAAAAVEQQCKEFLITFDGEAHKVLADMLTASRERIMSERERYGLTKTVTEKQQWKMGDYGEKYRETTYESTYGMGDNAGTKGLADAAKALAGKARTVRSLMDARNKLRPVSTSEFGPTDEDWAPYQAADKKVQQAAGEYNVLRFTSDKDYPILAAFDELNIDPATHGTWDVDKLVDRLTGLANRSSKDTAGTLYNETADKLHNIDKVTDAVAKGDLRVWRLDPVVSLTLQQEQSKLPAELQKRLVDDKAKESTPKELLDTALGVLAIALGAIAAIPTGGASLAVGIGVAAAGVGSAVLGGYFAIEHIQQYSLEAAANGTDFDKAKAVSQVEPSLFWLAVDIIGAMGGAAADIHAAAATFKTLSASFKEAAELRQLVKQGQLSAEADAALARLKQEADNVSPGLGEKLAAKIGKEGAAAEEKAAVAAWEDSLNPQSRAYLVDNAGVRAVYEDMDEEPRWLCTHCSDECLIKGLTHQQSARIRALSGEMDKEQLEALREFIYRNKKDVDGAIKELEHQSALRGMRERNPEAYEHGSLSEGHGPDVPEGHRLPRGTETPDPKLGGFWGGPTRGDGPFFSDNPAVNAVTGHRPIEFHNGFPDFSPWAQERVRIPVTGIDDTDFALADEIMAKQLNFKNQTAYAAFRKANALTWHHVEGAEEMILVPRALHANVPHVGGASEARATAGAAAP